MTTESAKRNVKKGGCLKETAYGVLKEKIIFCELLPGSVINEAEICDTLQIGRTPVREAILRLEREGYIVVEQRKSTCVSRISLVEEREITQMRLMIEPAILRSCAAGMTPERKNGIVQMQARFEQLATLEESEEKLKKFLEIDYEFHMALIALGDNQIILNTMDDLLKHCTRYWYFMFKTMNQRVAHSMREHLAIISCIAQDNYEKAAAELKTHIEKSEELDCFV